MRPEVAAATNRRAAMDGYVTERSPRGYGRGVPPGTAGWPRKVPGRTCPHNAAIVLPRVVERVTRGAVRTPSVRCGAVNNDYTRVARANLGARPHRVAS